MADREITISVCNECQSCNLMRNKTYHSDILPYCTLFKTFLQFREYENDDRVVKPCFECYECGQENTRYFRNGDDEWKIEVIRKEYSDKAYRELYSLAGLLEKFNNKLKSEEVLPWNEDDKDKITGDIEEWSYLLKSYSKQIDEFTFIKDLEV